MCLAVSKLCRRSRKIESMNYFSKEEASGNTRELLKRNLRVDVREASKEVEQK